MKETTKKGIIREIFSGANGKLSAKRVIGGIGIGVFIGCTIYLVILEGSNSVVENLLMSLLFMCAALLGLPAITGVWGKNNIAINNTHEETQQNQEHEENENIITPNDNNDKVLSKLDNIDKKLNILLRILSKPKKD